MEQNTTKNQKTIRFGDVLTKPETGHGICIGIFFFLSCLMLPLSDRVTLSAIYMGACAVLYYLLTHSFRAILYYALPTALMFVAANLLPALPAPILLPTAFLSLVMGGATGGFVLIHYHNLKKYPYILLSPVAAYCLSAWITGDPLRGLISLLPFGLAIVGALCVLLYQKRTDTILYMTAALVAMLAAAGLLTFTIMGIEGNPFTFVTDAVRGGIVSLLEEMEAMYAQAGMSLGLTDATVRNAGAMLINLIPAIFLVGCMLAAFCAHRMLLQFLVIFRSVPRLPIRLGVFTMSPYSAVLFAVAYLLALFTNYSNTTLFGTVCENLSLVLEPGLALVGITSLLPNGTARSCLSTFLLALIFILLFISPVLALELAAFIGVFVILAARFPHSPEQDNKGEK